MTTLLFSAKRKAKLRDLLTEAVKMVVLEQAPMLPPQNSPMGPPVPVSSGVPPTPVPPAPATNTSLTNSPPPPPAAPAVDPATGQPVQPFDIDTMIERLNTIRSGRSFADPEVYGLLTSYFKGMSEADKSIIQRYLENINRIVVRIDSGEPLGTGAPSTQPPMTQQQPSVPAQPAPVGGGGVVSEEVEMLGESVKPGVKFAINGKELEFGSYEHLRILKALLLGLQSLRDCYNMGSANRHVYSLASTKIRKLVDKLSPKP